MNIYLWLKQRREHRIFNLRTIYTGIVHVQDDYRDQCQERSDQESLLSVVLCSEIQVRFHAGWIDQKKPQILEIAIGYSTPHWVRNDVTSAGLRTTVVLAIVHLRTVQLDPGAL